MSIGKKVGSFADKMLKLTEKATKNLEEYAEKSAQENNNENAKKLSSFMKNINTKLAENHDEYIKRVEENATTLASNSTQIVKELKQRIDTAKEKAVTDAKKDDTKASKTKEETSAE